MSLDDFFKKPKTRSSKKKSSKKDDSALLTSQDGEEQEFINEEDEQDSCSELEMTDANSTRDDRVVDRLTQNIEELLDTKLAHILKPVTEMSEKMDKLVDRVGTVEQRVSDLEDEAKANSLRLGSAELELKKAMEKLENYENQSRRVNVKIVGLKEGTEGRNPVDYFEKWIPGVLNMDMQREVIKIERAHRLGPVQDSGGGRKPRAVLVRLRDYTDRQKILQAARKKGNVSFDGQEVFFYQDFSAEVVRRRKESASARKKLREAGVKYAFLYPAVIKVFPPNAPPIYLRTMKDISDYVKTLPVTH